MCDGARVSGAGQAVNRNTGADCRVSDSGCAIEEYIVIRTGNGLIVGTAARCGPVCICGRIPISRGPAAYPEAIGSKAGKGKQENESGPHDREYSGPTPALTRRRLTENLNRSGNGLYGYLRTWPPQRGHAFLACIMGLPQCWQSSLVVNHHSRRCLCICLIDADGIRCDSLERREWAKVQSESRNGNVRPCQCRCTTRAIGAGARCDRNILCWRGRQRDMADSNRGGP